MVYDLDSIKQHNPIADVVARHGVALRETGSHLVGLCPFHKDKHPSLAVYPETRSFYCFGCNAVADSLGVVLLALTLMPPAGQVVHYVRVVRLLQREERQLRWPGTLDRSGVLSHDMSYAVSCSLTTG